MTLDLTRLRPRLNELLLLDTCQIWRDPEGSEDDVTDPITGEVTGPSPDISLVYTGSCNLKHVLHGMQTMESGASIITGEYEGKVPGGAVTVKPGDWLKMISSSHDPTVVNKWFRVREMLHGSLSVFTKFRAELREEPSDRP